MNISPINTINSYSNQNQVNQETKNLYYPKFQTLPKDTVSFSGGTKVLQRWTNEIPHHLAQQVSKEAVPDLKKFLTMLRQNFKALTIVEKGNAEAIPILKQNSIKGRVKKAESIMEKAISRRLVSKKEIEQMGDLIGARIVLNQSTQNDFDKIFEILGKLVKSGSLKVTEIENYRPTRQQSFVSSKTLDKFEKICRTTFKSTSLVRTGKAIDNGYSAVHLTVELPSGKLCELQLMSKEMETIKDIEDFYYKLRNGKNIDPKYKTIETIMRSKLSKLTDFQKETLEMYIKDSYAYALEVSKHPEMKSPKKFIDFPYSLPKELSFSELAKMKERCDKASKTI